jgi:hypothetical protein
MIGFHRSQTKQKEGGYILLLSILITSIILAVSFGVYAIGLKSILLSSFMKDSQRALAAADRGAECALYWDYAYRNTVIGGTVFPPNSAYAMPGNANLATCAGMNFVNNAGANWATVLNPATGNTTFSLTFPDGTCANVRVYKTAIRTEITSDGVSDCNPNNLRRTQRSIQVYSQI